jgi:hypothetical protein
MAALPMNYVFMVLSEHVLPELCSLNLSRLLLTACFCCLLLALKASILDVYPSPPPPQQQPSALRAHSALAGQSHRQKFHQPQKWCRHSL